MANSAQARKRARQAEKHRQQNASQRSELRTYVKKVQKALAGGDAATAQAAYKDALPVIDAMARKGLIHKNKAARHKSRLNQHVRALSAG
ncbi:MAG TPA: 30S ribosomal protein S20 [Gammaproteobacteria bacterium]|nr:30S ribosomal protein S20 [Gammaproteobacteria bacterium]